MAGIIMKKILTKTTEYFCVFLLAISVIVLWTEYETRKRGELLLAVYKEKAECKGCIDVYHNGYLIRLKTKDSEKISFNMKLITDIINYNDNFPNDNFPEDIIAYKKLTEQQKKELKTRVTISKKLGL